MINQNGWLDWAEHNPAPAHKVNGGINPARIYIPHSAVGYWGGYYSEIYSQNTRKSVHGWIAYDGKVIQAYPLTAQVWGSGSTFPNNNGIAFENEGGFSPENEPLTEGQIDSNVRILKDIAQWKGRPYSYWRRPTNVGDTVASLYEHRECVRFGSASTACPSGRIPWLEILSRLQEDQTLEDEMIRHNATHKDGGYVNRVVDGRLFLWDARGDFSLPANAKMARIEVFLQSGELRILDGDSTDKYAGQVGWDGARYGIIDVDISNGGMTFFGNDARFSLLGCVGYWK